LPNTSKTILTKNDATPTHANCCQEKLVHSAGTCVEHSLKKLLPSDISAISATFITITKLITAGVIAKNPTPNKILLGLNFIEGA
jgi:hypothetical protein